MHLTSELGIETDKHGIETVEDAALDSQTQARRPNIEDADTAAVLLAQSGDPSGFEQLYGRYRMLVSSVVTSVGADQNDREDLIQQTFISVHLGLSRFRHDCCFRTWLYRVAVNTTLKHFSKQRRRPESPLAEDEEIASRDYCPERSLHNVRARQAFNDALSALPDTMREGLSLAASGFSYEQIGQVMGCKMGTVRSRLSRARSQVRRAVEQ